MCRLYFVPEYALAVGHVGNRAARRYIEIENLWKDILVRRRVCTKDQIVAGRPVAHDTLCTRRYIVVFKR